MEDDLIFENGRRPHFLKIEDNLNVFENGGRPQSFENGRRTKKTSIYLRMEDDLKKNSRYFQAT
jgi:hypothetical protein